jgi:ubiquinone biosynthesis protein UbiJ
LRFVHARAANGLAVTRIPRSILASCERVLNHYLGESTAARDLVGKLQGKSLSVEVRGLALGVVLLADSGRITVRDAAPADASRRDDHDGAAEREGTAQPAGRSEPAPSAVLRAAPLDLARLLRAGSLRELRETRAELTGDLHVAESFAALLRHARPDLEEELSHLIGDIAAHEIGAVASGVSRWLSGATRAARMNTSEYLQEESRTLPAPLEARSFYAEVERLRDDVERAAQRVERLAMQLAARNPGPESSEPPGAPKRGRKAAKRKGSGT